MSKYQPRHLGPILPAAFRLTVLDTESGDNWIEVFTHEARLIARMAELAAVQPRFYFAVTTPGTPLIRTEPRHADTR